MVTLLAVAVAVSCTGDEPPDPAAATSVPSSTTVPSSSTEVAVANAPRPQLAVPYCDEVADNTASLDFAGAQYRELVESATTAAALDVAVSQPQFVMAWTRDRHETWTIVGVTGGMIELQAELDAAYPGARVLYMNVDWSPEQLEQLARTVASTLELAPQQVRWSHATGYVAVGVDAGRDPPTELASFAGERVCVDAAS